ncbi:hypothetical protein LCGC14_0550100 [marine sediment metagenome]|uniref:Uncharacterized protein n=1 Tax=marine sediment metagenome TaxID=412755 RepID=A0A0F9UYF4_9ZZZZ
MLFWLAQKRKLGTVNKAYNLVVTLKDLPKYNYKYVYQLSVKELNKFIITREKLLNQRQIEQIKDWLVNLRIINPRPLFWRFY